MVLRLCLDLNVFFSEIFSRARRIFPSAASELVDWVDSGSCPAGPVQLIISWPMIEQWESILVRHLGMPRNDAETIANGLAVLAMEGPIPEAPHIVLGSGFVPFATEAEMVTAAKALKGRSARNPESTPLLDEVEEDRIVYLTAIAAGADVLVTDNMKDFRRGDFREFERDDIIIISHGEREVVVATPFFVANWLRSGIAINADFIRSRPAEFVEKLKPREAGIEPK